MVQKRRVQEPDLFDKVRLPPEVDAYLRSTNPWWHGQPGRPVPPYRRWAFPVLLKRLESGLAPAVLVRGARQVGKTTLQEQVIEHLLADGVSPERVLRVQFDELPSLRALEDPILAIAGWFENRVLGRTLNAAARAGKGAYLFFDEVQNLADWAPQLKALVDHHSARVVVTGSSALRIEAGRDSLAGRVTTVELGTLLLREIAEMRFGGRLDAMVPANGLGPLLEPGFWREAAASGLRQRAVRDRAFRTFSARGAYPMAQARPEVPWPEVADQLNETVIRRVIQHDLRVGDRGRKRDPKLLEELFRVACRFAGQAPARKVYLDELQRLLQANIGWQRVLAYLRFLDLSLLLKLVPPLELRLRRRRGDVKLCLLDPSLRASWLEEVIPLDGEELLRAPHLSDLAGRLAESTVGAFLAGIPHLDLAWLPERAGEPEVDFVLTIGERRIPLEVKYQRRVDPFRDTFGLRSFLDRAYHHAPFGILVTMADGVEIPDPRIVAVALPSLLLAR